nr:ABC transporter ATP-binding protein [Membranihabitans marinus]
MKKFIFNCLTLRKDNMAQTFSMIELKNIKKAYKTDFTNLQVLKGIDLDIEEGEFVSIMGSSGSGKSTLLNILGILDEYDSGKYTLAGQLMQNLSEKQAAYFRNRFIGFVFQSFNLLSFKTAVENVALPLYYQKINRIERLEKAMHYLEMVGLKEWANHHPNQLSGGQQQRVAIARALVTEPKVLLADEPTGALDSKTSSEVMDLFEDIHQAGKTVIIVTHELDIAQKTERIIRIQDGLILNREI